MIATWVLSVTSTPGGLPAAGQPADALRRLLPRARRPAITILVPILLPIVRSSGSTRCTSAW
jgi:hypothetical protein